MSKIAINGERCVELFSPISREILNTWKVHPDVKKIYDEKLKSFVYCLKGTSPNRLMQWPKDKAKILDHPIIVFQVYIATGANILFDIIISCHKNLRKRITLSTNKNSVQISVLSVVLPLSAKKTGEWSHLLVDLDAIVSSVWERDAFQHIDSVCLSGSCSVKKIFTLTRGLVHDEEGFQFVDYQSLPKQMLMSKSKKDSYMYIYPCLEIAGVEKRSSFALPSTPRSELASATSLSNSWVSKSDHRNFTSSSASRSVKSSASMSSLNDRQNVPCRCVKSKYTEKHDDKKLADQVIPLLSRLTFVHKDSTSVPTMMQSDREAQLPNKFDLAAARYEFPKLLPDSCARFCAEESE